MSDESEEDKLETLIQRCVKRGMRRELAERSTAQLLHDFLAESAPPDAADAMPHEKDPEADDDEIRPLHPAYEDYCTAGASPAHAAHAAHADSSRFPASSALSTRHPPGAFNQATISRSPAPSSGSPPFSSSSRPSRLPRSSWSASRDVLDALDDTLESFEAPEPPRAVSAAAPRAPATASSPAQETLARERQHRSALQFLSALHESFDRVQHQLVGRGRVAPVHALMAEIQRFQNEELREELFLSETWNAACLDEEDRQRLLRRTHLLARAPSSANPLSHLFRMQTALVEQLQRLCAERRRVTDDILRALPCSNAEENKAWQAKLQQLVELLRNEQKKRQFLWSCIACPTAPALFARARVELESTQAPSSAAASPCPPFAQAPSPFSPDAARAHGQAARRWEGTHS